MNYGQFKRQVRARIDELSSRGVDLPANKVADLVKKSDQFVNATIYDLATSTAKRPAVFYISHNPLYNELMRDTSSVKKHLPGTDFAVELVGAKSCFFEATGPATITIDEKINGVWTNLITISIPATQTTFAEYKRLINASNPANSIRLNFTGNYPYDFRNYVLYPYAFTDEASIQQHRPHFIYNLPSDFLKINKVLVRKDQRQYVPYVNYIERPDGKIGINRYEVGEYEIHYWRKPILLTFTGDANIDDAQELDLAEDAAHVASYAVAGEILLSEGEANGLTLINQYEAKKANLITNDIGYQGNVLNIYGW